MVSKPHSSSNLPSKYRKSWEIVKFCDTYYAATTRIPTMWFTSNPHSSSRIVTYLVSIAVPSTRCAHHACTNLRESNFKIPIFMHCAYFLVCISWIRAAVAWCEHLIVPVPVQKYFVRRTLYFWIQVPVFLKSCAQLLNYVVLLTITRTVLVVAA